MGGPVVEVGAGEPAVAVGGLHDANERIGAEGVTEAETEVLAERVPDVEDRDRVWRRSADEAPWW